MRGIFSILALLGAVALVVGVAIPIINQQDTLDMQSRVNVYWGALAGGGLAALIGGCLGLGGLEAADRIAAAIRDAARGGQVQPQQPAVPQQQGQGAAPAQVRAIQPRQEPPAGAPPPPPVAA